MEFCVYCNRADFEHHGRACEHCDKFPMHHKIKKCQDFIVNLDDEWGMARRSDEWKAAEQALRKVVCKEYGHGFFSGPPYTWKTYCRRCGEINMEREKENAG